MQIKQSEQHIALFSRANTVAPHADRRNGAAHSLRYLRICETNFAELLDAEGNSVLLIVLCHEPLYHGCDRSHNTLYHHGRDAINR